MTLLQALLEIAGRFQLPLHADCKGWVWCLRCQEWYPPKSSHAVFRNDPLHD